MLDRPALLAACALAAGIATRESARIAAPDLAVLAFAAAIGLAAAWRAIRVDSTSLLAPGTSLRLVGALCLIWAAGYLRASANLHHHGAVRSTLSTASEIRGRIRGMPRRDTFRTTVLLDLEGRTGRVRLTLSRRAHTSLASTLQDGADVTVRGPLDVDAQKRNPGDFAYDSYLRSRGISGAATVVDPGRLSVSAPAGSTLWTRARNAIRASVAEHAQPAARPYLEALLLGDRSSIEPDQLEILSRVGLIHLLAVSGLHVMLVAFVVHRFLLSVLARLKLPWRFIEFIRTPVTITILVAYAILTGAPPSAVRAAVMGGVLLARSAFARGSDTLNALGFAACILLYARPPQLLNVGFQLSFAALIGIVAVAPAISALLARDQRAPGMIARSIAVSAGATAGTAPVLVNAFGVIPLAGIALNVVAIPLAAAALAAGLLLVITEPLSADVASLFGHATSAAIVLLNLTADFADRSAPFLAVVVPGTKTAVICSIALTVCLTVHAARVLYAWRVTVAAVAFVASALAAPVVKQTSALFGWSDTTDIVFLDVGHGDALVIVAPDRRSMVVDVGPAGYAPGSVASMVRRLGARTVDLLVFTHPHADHVGGKADFLRHQAVRHIVSNDTADAVHPSHREAHAGDRIALGRHLQVTVLHPPAAPGVRSLSSDVNNDSIVLRVDHGEVCFLLMGDVESEAESRILRRRPRLDCAVVKVGHHGSRTSSTAPFVRSTDVRLGEPAFAVFSVGARNRFGLPDDEVVAAWVNRGRHIATTANGAVWLRSDGRSIYRVVWR